MVLFHMNVFIPFDTDYGLILINLRHTYILADGGRLYNVFDNLITNAIKYSMENTRVYIQIERMDDQDVYKRQVQRYAGRRRCGQR